MTGLEHLNWAKARAREYLEDFQVDLAFLSFVSNLAKHPKTGPLVTLDKMRAGNAILLAERITKQERVGRMANFIDKFELTFTLVFVDARVAGVYFSMCEGMEEVRRDCGENDTADLMDALARRGWNDMRIVVPGASIPIELEMPMELCQVAKDVLENCLDNSSGLDPEDDEAEMHLFIGDVTIEREDIEC